MPLNKSKLITALLFVFCGIPGVLILQFSFTFLVATILDPKFKGPNNKLILSAVSLFALFLIFAGVGKLNRPAYSLVFIMIPIHCWLYSLIDPHTGNGYLALVLFLISVSCLTFYGVQRYYRRLDSDEKISDADVNSRV